MKFLFTYRLLLIAVLATVFGRVGLESFSESQFADQETKVEVNEHSSTEQKFFNEYFHRSIFSNSEEKNGGLDLSFLEDEEEEENEQKSSLKSNPEHYAFCIYLAQIKWELLGFKKIVSATYPYFSSTSFSRYIVFQVFRI